MEKQERKYLDINPLRLTITSQTSLEKSTPSS